MKTKTDSKKTNKKSNRKSLRGVWGKVGAPPKKTNWPNKTFTMAVLFARNSKQCELSLRTKVDAGVKSGDILALMPKKQPGGKVGRPKSVFVLKDYFVPGKMELAPAKSAPAQTVVATVTPAEPVIAPAPMPVMEINTVPASVEPVIEVPSPVVVETPAVVESVPVAVS